MPSCFHYSDEACYCFEDADVSDGCPTCNGEGDGNGECWNCDPSCSLEYSPVRASFLIVDGVVSEVAL